MEPCGVEMRYLQPQGSVFLVNVPNTKNRIPRCFTIMEAHARIVRKYQALRPPSVPTDPFFLNYRNRKCTSQVIGRNKFAACRLKWQNSSNFQIRNHIQVSYPIFMFSNPNTTRCHTEIKFWNFSIQTL